MTAAAGADEKMSSEAEAHSFPAAKRHDLSLSSGRTLAYYTFDETNGSGEDAILYLNGFPGSGLEGGVCAGHAKTKTFVALDRPGLGYTDLPRADEKDPFATVCSDIWELASHLNWKKFSLVGISGGGPHALALLASYLTSSPDNKPKLEKVALVGGICPSAGTEGLMPDNQKIFELVKTYEGSRMSRFQLRLMFAVPHYLLPILPTSMVHGMIKGNKDLPEVDFTIFQDNPPVVELMSEVVQSAVRQGSAGVVADARRCFTPGFETVLKEKYDSSNVDKETLPQVYIYQGKLDTNVPPTHATYMHEEIFQKEAKLHTYDDLGHISLVLNQAKTYIQELERTD